MPHSTASPLGTIETTINYYNEPPPGEQFPVQYVHTVGSKRLKHNVQNVRVTDLRSTDNHFTIHENGFQFLQYPGEQGIKHETFADDDAIKTKVYEEVKDVIKKATGASDVLVFNHVCRREPYQVVLDIPQDAPDMQKLPKQHPAMLAHVDQSYHGADLLLATLNHEGAAEIKAKAQKHRWGIINLWKPLRTIIREPLAVCDATTVPESDLRPVTLRILKEDHSAHMTEDRDVELWYIAHNPQHRWYWPSEMKPDEALLIKCFDSKTEGVARRAPHSAIRLPNDQGPPRESIELRAIVVYAHEAKA
ncbi:Putative hydroxylase/desaturase AsaB [Septoria linicola]|uniref:Hydroxylase/desaturase AsaB n=1 Tax=Septoria linicola TaxID=215465 RepID=A0A9Q9ES14_9PEZI|nr:Putative hydroxylase/desaturase AsaB [Septoria linicola]